MGSWLNSAALALALVVAPVSAGVQAEDTVSGDKGTDMVLDAVVMRPPGLTPFRQFMPGEGCSRAG